MIDNNSISYNCGWWTPFFISQTTLFRQNSSANWYRARANLVGHVQNLLCTCRYPSPQLSHVQCLMCTPTDGPFRCRSCHWRSTTDHIRVTAAAHRSSSWSFHSSLLALHWLPIHPISKYAVYYVTRDDLSVGTQTRIFTADIDRLCRTRVMLAWIFIFLYVNTSVLSISSHCNKLRLCSFSCPSKWGL